MKFFLCISLLAGTVAAVTFLDARCGGCPGMEEMRGRLYIDELNQKEAVRNNLLALSQWNYASNITDENLKKKLELSAKIAKVQKEEWKTTVEFNWQSFKDPDLRRQFKLNSMLGTPALPEDKYERLQNVIADMQKTYATGKICDFNDKTKCDLSLEPELVTILSKSRNPEELKHVWVEWRKATGKTRVLYTEYVSLLNEAARLNNYTNNAEMWLQPYEDDKFRDEIAKIWEQMKPFYLQIHAYVRNKLRAKYGNDVVSEKGPIPAHLLGNMWAQTWDNIGEFTTPYPNKQFEDLSEELQKQGYTPLKMFKAAEEFFTSINMTAMPPAFWEKSILEKPQDGRSMVCHASAWDFYDREDFRIKQCTKVNMEDFRTAHHEMGHIEYYLQYKNQPPIYKGGANPGFHEAVGDTMALSVSTRKHLHKIGLIKNAVEADYESTINELYETAIGKIVFPAFGYVMDLWRWDVFAGKITADDYNCRWWQLRQDIQGVEPPVDRTEEDFDPASKYHTVASVPYIRYFVSYVVQFQFHRTLCQIAGEFDPTNPEKPLYNCDIYGNTNAGNAMKKMLALGSSKPWQDAMEMLTGQRKMDASGILDYFEPLQRWLENENKRTGAFIGWEESKRRCVKGTKEYNHEIHYVDAEIRPYVNYFSPDMEPFKREAPLGTKWWGQSNGENYFWSQFRNAPRQSIWVPRSIRY